jgi:predicted DNA-binding transcriptional regulator AlpA
MRQSEMRGDDTRLSFRKTRVTANPWRTKAMNVALRQYRVTQMAAFLSLSVREVWRLVSEGKLAAPVKIGRCSVWFESDIVEFQTRLREQRQRRSL